MSKMLDAVGNRLREERERIGFDRDQEGFAEKAGISKTSLGNYETGKAAMKVPVLMILDDIGVDILYVLTGRRGEAGRGFIEQNMLDMLARLSMRERQAVHAMVSVLAGDLVSLKEIDLANIGATLHAPKREFRRDGE